MNKSTKSIEINAPVDVVFDLYSNFERFPEWMSHLQEVRQIDEKTSIWKADAPLGLSVEWEAETTEFKPGEKIAWRTVRGDIHLNGEVTFKSKKSGKTSVRAVLEYEPPAGKLGAFVSKLIGSDPETQIAEELRRFADLAERTAAKATPKRKASRSAKRKAA